MPRKNNYPFFFIPAFFLTFFSFAQSGPGGVGTSANNVIWLDASTLGFANGADVTSWTDISGNSVSFGASGDAGSSFPDFLSDGGAGFPAVEFDDTNEERLIINPFSNMPSTAISTIIVFATANNGEGIISYSAQAGGGGNNEYLIFDASNIRTFVGDGSSTNGSFNDGASTYNIFTSTWQSTGGSLSHYKNGTSVHSATLSSGDVIVNNGSLAIGGEQDSDDGGYAANQDFGGRIAEIIMYNSNLSNAERIVIENYLSLKYGITISNDFYSFATAPYDESIIGIGAEASSSHLTSTGTGGGLYLSGTAGAGATTFDANEWIFAAHDGAATNAPVQTDMPGGTRSRIDRIWAVDETATDGFDATFTFNLDELGLSGASNFALFKRTGTSGTFSEVTTGSQTGAEVTFSVSSADIEDAYFTLGFDYPLLVWLKADAEATVGTWGDQSANANDATSPENDPTIVSSGINFNPAFRFTTAGDRMQGTLTTMKDSLSFLVVAKDESGTNSNGVLVEFDAATDLTLDDNSYAGISFSSNIIKDSAQLITVVHPEGTGPASVYQNGGLFETGVASAAAATTYTYALGDNVASTNGFDGLISEFIAFDVALSSAQRQILESYLAMKYALPVQNDIVASNGSVVFDASANAGFPNGLFGLAYDDSTQLDQKVARSEYDSIFVATTNDFASDNAARPTAFSDLQYLAITNNGQDYDLDSAYKSEANVRMNRVWKVHELNAPGNVVVAIPNTINGGVYASLNSILVSSDPFFQSGVVERTLTTSGNFKIATIDFSDGQYFTYTTAEPESSIWYSYLSGNWSDPANWTLDGATSPLYLNPGSEIPSEGDSVVVRSGRTITSDINGIVVERVEILGSLDLASSSGHDFTYILGNGELVLSGAAGVDNYPAGVDTLFYSATEGGTVRYAGGGLTLDTKRRYNNLTIALDASSNEIIQTADSIWVNGNFTITQGTFQFGDNSVADDEVAEVQGDVLVESNGVIEVAPTNSRHEFNLYGNFTNQGNVAFTNRTAATFTAEATDGIVDVNFVSATQDQVVDLQNTTNFYRIEINKGVDATYKAQFSADDPSYFALYGYAAENHGSIAQLTTNSNSLGLIYGTVELGTNVVVGRLANGNYNVSEGASIVMSGGSITEPRWIVAYGSVIVNSGSIDLGIGTVTRNSGSWEVNGGVVDMGHFRTSGLGAGNDGSWTQTGGVINFTGNSNQSDYYTFSLTYETCSFTMTGGEMNLTIGNGAPEGYKGLFLNSAPENTTVTGGTITIDQAHTETDSLLISSTVPFYNLTLKQSVANANPNAYIFVSGGNSGGSAPDGVTLGGNTLVVKNDFTIDNADGNTTTVDFDGNDVEVTGNLTIQSGAVTDFTDMTLRMNGTGSSEMDIQLATTLMLDSLEINKSDRVDVTITNGQATAIEVDHYLNLAGGNFDIDTYNIQLDGNMNIADTIGSATSTGVLSMLGEGESVAQSITASGSAFVYDLLIDNDMNIALSGGDLGINSLDLNDGVFDLGANKMRLNTEVQTTGAFASDLMIQSSGSSSDGGLEYYFDGTSNPAEVLYPIGSNSKYTPAQLDLINVSDDGFVQINPVDGELLTSELSGGDILDYYWRVRNSSFSSLPDVSTLTFTADAADDPTGGPLTSFVPGGVEDGVDSDDSPTTDTNFNRFSENSNGISGLVIEFDGEFSTGSVQPFQLRTANYTAGVVGRFPEGSPDIYYTTIVANRQNWSDEEVWTLVDDAVGADDGNTGFPGAGDIAVLRNYGNSSDDHWVTVNTDITVAQLIFDNALGGWSPRAIVSDRDANLDLGPVSGVGQFQLFVDAANTPAFIGTTDLGDFSSQTSSQFNFRLSADGVAQMPSNITEYPQVRIEAGNGANDDDVRILETSVPITINNFLQLDRSPRFRINHDVNVVGDVRVTWQLNRTTIEIGDDREVTFDIGGDLLMRDGAGDDAARLLVKNDNLNGYEHTIRVRGNIDFESGLAATSSFDLYNGASPNNNAILELSGEGDFSLTNNAPGVLTPDLYRIVMNAGSDTTSTFTFNDTFTLGGINTTSPQSLELQNGKLILNDPTISVELADNSDFAIPSTAGLEVTQGTVTSTGANIVLDGLLRINGGTATLASSDIEYTSSGNALLSVSAGTLNLGGQVRRSLTSTNGVLKYRQLGGDVDIATDGAGNSTRGAFEILNPGSEFTLTGGTFNIERGVTGDANVSLRLDPATTNLSGSTITVFENLGANYGSNFFNIASTIALDDLTIANSIDLPDVQLFTQNLEVNNLTINANQALLANNFNLTINGNLTNNGVYTNTATETILAGSGAQSISGSGTNTLYDLRKSGSGTTTSSVALTVDHDLFLTGGTLDIGANALNVGNDAFVQSTLTNSGGNGLVFNGSSNQELSGLTNSAVNIGTITISNPNGVDIPDGNGYDFNITQELRLDGGVFNIGGSLVTMVAGAPITEVSTFSVNNMVQTNSSFTDNGLNIEFFTVASDTVVFFPIGELKYTPVEFDLNTGTTAGSIRVRPANERHPTIVNDAEPGTAADPEIDDTQNVLQYHWIVVAESLTNATGDAIFFYDNDDITNTETDTANFISARLLANGVTWDKFAPTLFRGASQTFQVPLSTFTAAEITGDYTAGAGSSDGVNADIEGAIPDQLAQYETAFTGSGNYSAAANWNTLNGPDVTDGVGPVGAQIIVRNGDDLTLDLNNIRLYSTDIEAGGILRIPAGTIGVRLGTVTGNGTIVLEDNELLPTGEYTDFLACDGGALQYSGTTTYNVLSGISQIRKVIFDGSGTRTMPNNLLSICDTLEINGPTVAFNSGLNYNVGDADTDRFEIQSGTVTLSNGSSMALSGDFVMSGGSFTGASGTTLSITDDVNLSGGTLNWNGSHITLNGSTSQLIDGDFTSSAAFDDLTLTNGSGGGVTINSGDIEVTGLLTLTDGLLNTSSTETLTLTATGDWAGASSASYVTGPITKVDIPATSTYEFPVGKSVRYAPAAVVNVGTGSDDWTAEYLTSTNPTYDNATFDTSDPGSGFNALTVVRSTDRWEITSAGSNTAQVRGTYGAHNFFPDEENIRIVWWDDEAVLDGDGADNRWENQGGLVTGTVSAGTVTSENTVFFSTRQFGLGYAPEVALPVELISFTGEIANNVTDLRWETASEENNDYFEVQHSLDGKDFQTIGVVEGVGNSNEVVNYSFRHTTPGFGENYYRLRQVDFDGMSEVHETIRLTNDFIRRGIEAVIYPNPGRVENIRLRLSSGDDHTAVSIRILDLNGKVYFSKSFDGDLNIDERLEVSNEMTSGIYFVEITQGENTDLQKLVVR